MGFKEIKQRISRNLEERRIENAQISSANKIIQREATAEALRAKRDNEIRIARERQNIIADRKIKEIRANQGRSGFWSVKPTFDYFGMNGTPVAKPSQPQQKIKWVKKGRKKKRVVYVPAQQLVITQQRFDPIGGFGNASGKRDVLGW